MQRINDEILVAALVAVGSVRRAATAVGCSPATIQNRMKDDAFRASLENAWNAVLSETCASITSRLTLAADVLCEVLEDKTAPSTVRVSAADSLLRHGLRYVSLVELERRLEALEARYEI